MKLHSLPVRAARGAILAHSQRTGGGVIRKGTLLGDAEVEALSAAGIDEVVAAALEAGDVGEDEAARALAEAVAGAGVRVDRADTGRANLFAETDGVLCVAEAAVHALNAVDPAITLATIAPFQRVLAGQMVGTVKIIPFAVPRAALQAALATLGDAPLAVAGWRVRRVGTVSTTLPALKDSVIGKTLGVLERRLADPGAEIVSDLRVPHTVEALATAVAEAPGEVVIVFGASAVMDADDVIPAAIRAAGGEVEHVGMPVDPGNLLVLGRVAGRPVIGAPGCARSPKRNGFDFVLDRLLAGVPVGAADIMRMGVGGLLTDTPARPRPRRGAVAPGAPQRPAAIVLAAGRSTRMGAANKLLEEVAGRPMVRHVAEAALASRTDPVMVVTGHEAERVRAALDGLDVAFVHNPDYADGLSTSLRTGLLALPAEADAALILLGDMPLVRAADCNALVDALGRDGALIAMATADGARGNPVAWSRALFSELRATEGDAGGRALLSRYVDSVVEVEIGAAGALDADTPAALDELRRRAR